MMKEMEILQHRCQKVRLNWFNRFLCCVLLNSCYVQKHDDSKAWRESEVFNTSWEVENDSLTNENIFDCDLKQSYSISEGSEFQDLELLRVDSIYVDSCALTLCGGRNYSSFRDIVIVLLGVQKTLNLNQIGCEHGIIIFECYLEGKVFWFSWSQLTYRLEVFCVPSD